MDIGGVIAGRESRSIRGTIRPSSLRAVIAGNIISHNSKAAVSPAPSSNRCKTWCPSAGCPR